MSSTATISVHRQDDDSLGLRAAYFVSIDGVVVGGLMAGDKKVFEVPAGHHQVRVHYAWLSSNSVTVSPVMGQEVDLLCSGTGWLGKLVYSWLLWDRYLLLRLLASDGHVSPAVHVVPLAVPRDVAPGLAGA